MNLQEQKIIAIEKDYNKAVQSYNTKIRKIRNMFARRFKFGQREYFEINSETKELPEIGFLKKIPGGEAKELKIC